MLQIKNICKQYKTGDLIQIALNDVSLNLRDNEFVAILGPSGSGKTTLLNVIGGLDQYDSGDLIINSISTKKYKNRDWDAYRNHTIGFVFQSYNLIPHQSVLSNVELALTISGVSRSERRKRAKEALEKVGLGDQCHKRPNQMSGGQMQRVAIARALVNNPDILLADEPTGALDTETGIQVMELLKEVAKDKLVVMVTHNPDLAEQYANRIVKLRDGHIIDDTNPYTPDDKDLKEPEHKKMGKSSMSFLTALSLSFNNLRTKKGRTILTSFAGSIGIIGISLILALSNGVNTYITDIQKSTMSSYPITIESESIDLSSIMNAHEETLGNDSVEHKLDKVYSNSKMLEMQSEVTTSITHNNLTEFKKYLDNSKSKIHQYVGENGIVYSYDTRFGVYTYDSEDTFVNTDGSTLSEDGEKSMMTMSPAPRMAAMGLRGDYQPNPNFQQLLPGKKSNEISTAVTESYELVYGQWPSNYDEVILVLDKNNEISLNVLYEIGMLPVSEYKEITKKINDGEEVEFKTKNWSYSDICRKKLYLIPECDTYEKNSDGNYESIQANTDKMKELMKSALQLKITGVVRMKEDSVYDGIQSAFGYTKELTDYIINVTNESEVVKAQKANKEMNVLNGMKFEPSDDDAKINDLNRYIQTLNLSERAVLAQQLMMMSGGNMPTESAAATTSNPPTVSIPTESAAATTSNPSTVSIPTESTSVPNTVAPSAGAISGQPEQMTEEQLASMLDSYLETTDREVLLSLYDSYIPSDTYDDNLTKFGVVSLDAPSAINIYTDSFEDKDAISECIDEYNSKVSEENQINFTDYVGLLMSSVTTIVNVISYVLIAFVAVSLVVSSIMIGIITYISVLERTKEIGILRAIGASKHNISQVFNAETFIIGLLSGLMGIGVTLLLLIPGNLIIHAVVGTDSVNAILPITGAIVLIVLSVVLTLIGGLIPSKKAANKDPVTALRTE